MHREPRAKSHRIGFPCLIEKADEESSFSATRAFNRSKRLERWEKTLAKRYNSSFAVPSGFAFSARVGKGTRPAAAAEAKGKKTSAPSIPDRREPVSARRQKAA